MSWQTDMLVKFLAFMPDNIIWKFARRYIAGATLETGLNIRSLMHQKGMHSTLDILGEDSLSELAADNALAEYLRLVEAISLDGLPGNISLKLSQMGLKLNEVNTVDRMQILLHKASSREIFVRIDMEDASSTDQTFAIYRFLRKKYAGIGVAIQAYLRRSYNDVKSLQADGDANFRLCKGIYVESPDIAFKDPNEIRQNYMKIVRLMIENRSYIGMATHDPFLIDQCLCEIVRRKLSTDCYEFQMLHGVGEHLRKKILDGHHRLRIYIPFGKAWKTYSLRRFKENPALAWYIVKNLFLKS